MNMILLGILIWINSTGMITPVDPIASYENGELPKVVFVDNSGMAEQLNRCLMYLEPKLVEMYDVELSSYDVAIEHAEGNDAIYCENQITIKNHLDIDGVEHYVLVHEMVHWMQDQNGYRDEAIRGGCLLHIERDAYAIHHRWQEENGYPLFPDKFTAHIRSVCNHELMR